MSDHDKTPALAVSGPLGSYKLQAAPWCRRGEVTTLPGERMMLLHPLDLVTLQHGEDPHHHVDEAVGYHLTRALTRLDGLALTLKSDGQDDRDIIDEARREYWRSWWAAMNFPAPSMLQWTRDHVAAVVREHSATTAS